MYREAHRRRVNNHWPVSRNVDVRRFPGTRFWLAARPPDWRARIVTASLDPFRGYATALATQLPDARRVLDPFAVVKLGLTCLDEVRCRVQQDATGPRGRTGEALYGIPRRLRRRRDRLSVEARDRLGAGLIAGDPTGEVTLAWTVAPELMALDQLPDLDQARTRTDDLISEIMPLPDPRDRQAGSHPARLAHRITRALRPPRHVQRAHRKPESQD